MACLLIVAHAPLASALRTVVEHVKPESASQVRAVDIRAEMTSEDADRAVRGSLADWPTEPVLVVADVFGATPCNVAQRAADGARIRVIAGVNVPMLWRTVGHLDETLDELVVRALTGGEQGVMQVAANPQQHQLVHSRPHDPDDAHHQQ